MLQNLDQQMNEGINELVSFAEKMPKEKKEAVEAKICCIKEAIRIADMGKVMDLVLEINEIANA